MERLGRQRMSRAKSRLSSWIVIGVALVLLWGSALKAEETKVDYFPLQEGYSWTYRISSPQLAAQGKEPIELTVTNLAPEKLGEKQLYPQKRTRDDKEQIVYLDRQADGVYALGGWNPTTKQIDMLPQPLVYLKFPLEKGTAWTLGQNGLKASIVSTEEKVVVPAGTFERCLLVVAIESRLDTTFENQTWFAPGVGMVKNLKKANNADQEIVELTSFKK